MEKIFISLFLIVSSFPIHAATFGRVTAVHSETDFVAVVDGESIAVKLVDVESFALDPRGRERLRLQLGRELLGKWVMLERDGHEFNAYRSPDGLFINEWVVSAGIARSVCHCERLQHLEKKARITGQGFWAGGSSIYAEQLAPSVVLGEPRLAGRTGKVRTTAARGSKAARSKKR